MSRKKTTAEFIAQAQAAHPEYDYSQAVYVGNKIKLTVICPTHGPFSIVPQKHSYGDCAGCQECAKLARAETKRATSLRKFLARAREVHGERFDYSRVTSAGYGKTTEIVCPDHGPFTTRAHAHYGNCGGCDGCRRDKNASLNRQTHEEFVATATAKHGGKYSYDVEQYGSAFEPMKARCPEHGVFTMTPATHCSAGYGCPGCSNYGFERDAPAILYYLRIGDLYKVGVTNRTIEERMESEGVDYEVISIRFHATGDLALREERDILRCFAADLYQGPQVMKATKNTELFSRDVLEGGAVWDYWPNEMLEEMANGR